VRNQEPGDRSQQSPQLTPDSRPLTPVDTILFNGGVFQPQVLRDRVVDVMRPWFGKSWQPLILTSPSLDLAVAWGAAYFAWLRHSGGKRIGGGIPRSYYIGVSAGVRSQESGVSEEQSHSLLSVLC